MKRILSLILALATMLANQVVFADEPAIDKVSKEYTNPIADQLLAESATLDTSVFEGAPGYIMKDAFSNVSWVGNFGLPSGWDVDKRGGDIVGGDNSKCQIMDSSSTGIVSLSRKVLPHKSGKLTFETAFTMEKKAETGYSYTLEGLGKKVFKISTEGNNITVLIPDGKTKPVSVYMPNSIIRIKALIDVDSKNYELIVDGVYVGKFDFAEDATQIDKITVSTLKETQMSVLIRYIHMYFGYAVNETFMQAKEGEIPYDWERLNGGSVSSVTYDGSQVYPDTYSLAISDPTTIDGVNIAKKFEDKNGKIIFSTRFIITKKGEDSVISIGNGNQKAISLETTASDIVTGNGTIVKKDYKENLWYTLKMVIDIPAKKADIYLNYQKVLSDVPFENSVSALNTIRIETSIRKTTEMRIDDVQVYDDITPTDYVPAPQPVKPEGGLEVGMQMYSMWNDNHFGWDWISAYPDRIPYLGLYSEGKPEVADWVTKWQTEHGFSYRVEIFSRATANLNQPVKLPTRYNALYDGYLNSKYKDDIKFAMLWSGISEKTFGGFEDMKNNIIPHFMENFFNQPNYLIKDNKPVVFMFGTQNFVNILGGLENANKAIDYWNEECKKAGFDGILIISDGTSGNFVSTASDFAQGYVYSYGWQYDSRSAKTQLTRNDAYFASGAKTVGSVTMGWGRNAWHSAELGEIFATPETIKETIVGLKERFAREQDPTNMIILTCWDEYGEGHFFSPTRVHGFEYLNAVRDAVTSRGPKTSEDMPTARALARMDSLNLGSRRALKLIVENDPPVYVEDLVDRTKLQVLASWDFEKMTDLGGWTVDKFVENLRLENGALRGNATGADPGIRIDGLSIPANDVQMIKITTETDGAGKGVIYYQTTDDTEMGVQGKRFEVFQDSPEWKEYETFPYDRKKLTGNITAIRWDPQDAGFPLRTAFAVRKIEVLGYPSEPEPEKAEPIKATFNGSNKITQPPFIKDGVMYFAIHRPLFEMKLFKTTFEYDKGTYTIVFDGDRTAVLTVGSNIMKLDGVDVDLGAPCYYEKGNLFVPLRSTMEALGATVNWNSETNSIDVIKSDIFDSYTYLDVPDSSKPFSWMFDTRGTEGWTKQSDIGNFKAYQGSLVMDFTGGDSQMYSPQVQIPATEYKYLKIRAKNETNNGNMMFFFARTDDKSWGGGKRFDITMSTGDRDFKEYIVDVSQNELWKGTVTQFRVDPVSGTPEGTLYIDSIEFLKELPE